MSTVVEISIIIPVYNGSDFLETAITSALAQESILTEIIVVNDGSCDGGATERIALKYIDKIQYLSKPNGGVASALNHGLQKARGNFVVWLSHDDVLSKTALSRLYQEVLNRPSKRQKMFVYGGWTQVSKDADLLHEVNISNRLHPDFQNQKMLALLFSLIHGCSLLISRELISRFGGFREDLPTTQDYELWFRIMQVAEIVSVPEVLLYSRIHPNQGSLKIAGHTQEADELWCSFSQQLGSEPLFENKRENTLLFAAISNHLINSGYRNAFKSFRNLALRNLEDFRFVSIKRSGDRPNLGELGGHIFQTLDGQRRILGAAGSNSDLINIGIEVDTIDFLPQHLLEIALFQAARKYFGLSLDQALESQTNNYLYQIPFCAWVVS